MSLDVDQQAQALLERLAFCCRSPRQGYGSLSASIYDTAWLSMLQKPKNSGIWLFPESFDHILKHQLDSGGWPYNMSPEDEIMNTAAALLSMKKHLEADPLHQDWTIRICKAEKALQQMLDCWDISVCHQVGAEMLVANLISLLQDAGVNFESSRLGLLRTMRDETLVNISPDKIYEELSVSPRPLEALIGHIDFDRVRHVLDKNGSMMGSPASTAAYLMYASVWDDKAEFYLRKALNSRIMDKSAPCAWPTIIFEVSYAISTLLEAEIGIKEPEASTIGGFLEKALQVQSGTVDLALSTFADTGDTVVAALALAYINKACYVGNLSKKCQDQNRLETSKGEKNASFSTNCQVLIWLLMRREPLTPKLASQVAKLARFLCDEAFRGTAKDAWNKHDLYWIMLLSQAISKFYEKSENPQLREAVFQEGNELREQLPMITIQMLRSVQSSQNASGSWDGICEVTAYAILTLSHLSKLPWIQDLDDVRVISSIQNGRSFLDAHRDEWSQGHCLWIGEVASASNILSEACCLAAAATPIPSPKQTQPHPAFCLESSITKDIGKARYLLEATSLTTDEAEMRMAEKLACYALIRLRRRKHEMFPAQPAGKHKYMGITALIWIWCSQIRGFPVSLATQCELMALSVLVYQVDEFMESVVEREYGNHLSLVKTAVHQLCRSFVCSPESAITPYENGDCHDEADAAIESVTSLLGRFVSYFRHPAVTSSPAHLRTRVAVELEAFFMAHITQAEDNLRLQAQGDTSKHEPIDEELPTRYQNPGRTYFNWVHSTSATTTSCPLAFAFYSCMIRRVGFDIFSQPRTAYVAEDMCRHLASMCRMYNDYGSVARDREEGNVNSLNFPEFHGINTGEENKFQRGQALREMKEELMWVAEYERRCLDATVTEMRRVTGQQKLVNLLSLFIGVTDMYGQVYILKDLTNRVR